MTILGIETSTRQCSVALINETKLISEYRLSLERRHSERLLPLIDTLLKEACLSLSDLSGIAVAIGPGSFTGLRVGLATAKGLAIGRGVPILSIPTLAVLAAPLRHAKAVVVPMIVARKDEVYWALFSPQGEGMIRLRPDSVSSVQNLLDQIGQEQAALFIGEGAVSFHDTIVKQFKGTPLFSSIGLQSPLASSVAELGLSLFMKGEKTPPEELVPLYLSPFEPKVMRSRV